MIPPRASWFGGFYERIVGALKRSLKATLFQVNTSEDELRTIITEIEEALNRRPLMCPRPNEEHVLTPMHFLTGPPQSRNNEIEEIPVLWRRRLHYGNMVWRRFLREYLSSLRQWRTKNNEIVRFPVQGEVVLVDASPSPRMKWNLAKITAVYPHHADIFVKGKHTSRALKDLYPLEAEHVSDIPAFERNQNDSNHDIQEDIPRVLDDPVAVVKKTRTGRIVKSRSRLDL